MVSICTYKPSLKFYLLEGEVRHALGSYIRLGINNADGDNFKVVISGMSGFRKLLAEFFTRSNLFIHSLKITGCWLCKAPIDELISEADLIDATVRTKCWTESLPEMARQLDKITGLVESDIFEVPTRNFGHIANDELDSLLDQHLDPTLLPDSDNPCQWILVESNGDGIPIKSAGVSQQLVTSYRLTNFHIVSIFNDFRAKTILYRINDHPFNDYVFDVTRRSDVASPIVRESSAYVDSPRSSLRSLTDVSTGYQLCIASDIADYSNYRSFEDSSFSYYSNSFYSGIDSPLLGSRSNSAHIWSPASSPPGSPCLSSCSSTQPRTPLAVPVESHTVPASLPDSVAPDDRDIQSPSIASPKVDRGIEGFLVLPSEVDIEAGVNVSDSDSDDEDTPTPEAGWIYTVVSLPVKLTYGAASYVGSLFGY